MSRHFSCRKICLALAGLALGLMAAAGRAEDKKTNSDEVRFSTYDKVELKGTFYPGKPKGNCVLLVHAIGGNRQQQGWQDLAVELQAKGYSVLSFDLRGHGDSTGIEPEFWQESANFGGIKGANSKKAQISYKDFSRQYYPMLANDLAAAKRRLDKLNNEGACNSSNVFIVAADDGAAIAALWIASEWEHQRPKKNNLVVGNAVSATAEGEDIRAAVFLSMPSSLGGANVLQWLKYQKLVQGRMVPIVRDKMPMAFFATKKEGSSATRMVNDIKGSAKKDKKLEYTVSRVKDTTAGGVGLLKKSLETNEDIITYFEKVLDDRGKNAWLEREVDGPLYPVPLNRFGVR